MLVDAHCHLNSFSPNEIDNIISSLNNNYRLIDSSIDLKSSQDSLNLSRLNHFIYTSLGFHPYQAEIFSPKILEDYAGLINANPKVVSIGEVGLDYKAKLSLTEQADILRRFLNLAKLRSLAVVMHTRLDPATLSNKGFPLVLDILDEFFPSYEKVLFHCFSYSPAFLEEIIKRQGLVSFSLNVLRKNQAILSSLKQCPLENLILETDSPYMKVKNRHSTPLDISNLFSFVASFKQLSELELKETIFSNAQRLFRVNL